MIDDINKRLKATATATSMDWEVKTVEGFKQQVHDLVEFCRSNGKVIPLPVYLEKNEKMLGDLGLLLSQINCESCNALCCRQRTGTEDINGIDIWESDLELLSQIGKAHWVKKGESMYLPYPCPFLVSSGKKQCSIYQYRPITCILFPFQGGGWDANGEELLSVSSACPEGRRIARDTYMMTWRLRQRLKSNLKQGVTQ